MYPHPSITFDVGMDSGGSEQDLFPELGNHGMAFDSDGTETDEEDQCSSGEESIEEPSIMDCTLDEDQPVISFEIIEDSSKRGKSKLTDSRGYTYNVKRKRVNATDWQCTIRPKVNTNECLLYSGFYFLNFYLNHKFLFASFLQLNPCRAIVIEREGNFEVRKEHNHPGNVGASNALKIVSKIKQEAVANLFTAAPAIVDQVLLNEMPNAPCPSLPNPENLAHAANYLRKTLQPTDPTDLLFDLEEQHIPEGFLRKDIKVSIPYTI